GHQVVDVADARLDLADAAADHVAEDHEVQGHRDRRRQQGLGPDAQDAGDFAAQDGAECDELAGRVHAASLPLSTSRTNNSSRRLVLLRIERTVMPAADSAANRELRSWSRGISASIVVASTREMRTP